MSEYIPEQGQIPAVQKDVTIEELNKKVAAGNVIRGIGMGVITAIGVVSLVLQAQNNANTEKGLNDLTKKVNDLAKTTDSIADDVYEIMEQGCTGNSSSSSTQPVPWDPMITTDKPVVYIYPDEPMEEKPVVYLYGDKPLQEAHVRLTLHDAEMAYMWPAGEQSGNTYDWDVLAAQDGTVYDNDGNEYSYIFWEANDYGTHSIDEGFCVKGSETAEFLRDSLKQIGLTPEEYNEFIVYWMPRMQDNEYNIIRFAGLDPDDEYNQNYELHVTDSEGEEADSMLRVMMYWQASDEYVELEPQEFETFEREGFTVVEWGGSEIY